MKNQDIQKMRLPEGEYAEKFCDKNPPLNFSTAQIEANRCYFCYDAPCIEACPTEINIPNFIRKISTGNTTGAAMDILNQNIMGGTCSRACPVETLCEKACVRNTQEDKPVTIGLLQRFATDEFFATGQQPFKRKTPSGKRVAIVGAGPAGLSCAHKLSQLGHQVDIFDSRSKLGGLNEYGLAAYKMVNGFAQKEVNFILSLGGIEIHCNQTLGKEISLDGLKKSHDAIFLGLGLPGTNTLGIEGEDLPNVEDAIDYISKIRQAPHLKELKVGNKVIVLGGGNTAIDIAVQSRLLGAEYVTLVYRRGPDHMPATWKEQELAKKNGVFIEYWAKPVRFVGKRDGISSAEFVRTMEVKGKVVETQTHFTLNCDVLFKAIGQKMSDDLKYALGSNVKIESGKISVDSQFRTITPGIFAGGDCINGGDLTVQAVQDGKLAAESIHRWLAGEK